MDATILNQIQAAPEKYLEEAEKFLYDTEKLFRLIELRYAKSSAQYCENQTKLEHARAVHRAMTAIRAGLQVKYSDKVTLQYWLNSSFKLSAGK